MRVTIALPAYDEVGSLEPVVAEARATIADRALADEAEILAARRSLPQSATLLPEILFRARRRGARLVPQRPRLAGRAKGGQLSVAALTFVELLRLGVLVRLDLARGVRRSV